MSCSTNSKGVCKLIMRVSFGLSLLFVGAAHYMTLDAFVGMTSDGLGPLASLGTVWAYVLPALMIVGGALITVNMYHDIAVWTSGLALGSIPAGMLAKPLLSGVALPDVMPFAINAFIWLLVWMMVVKCCGGSCSSSGSNV